ncbi:hypothetical protein DY245_14695 [Streptomyces inhibens]|uniref:Uncharacterized protein n=1 Tax=Streptomyces inhibens TaxID=2293571 RepID=A0A371Q4E9_STRIH|nr:hypothetical protein DY245_14695 [Streptomyces inhibens]
MCSTLRHRARFFTRPWTNTRAWAGRSRLLSAQARWRVVNAPHLVALVRAGARFERGRIDQRPEPLAA